MTVDFVVVITVEDTLTEVDHVGVVVGHRLFIDFNEVPFACFSLGIVLLQEIVFSTERLAIFN